MPTPRTVLAGLGILLAACSGSSSSGSDLLGSAGSGASEQGASGAPSGTGGASRVTGTKEEEEVPPRPSLYVEASIISATLGDDCGDGARFSGDCAPTPDGTGCGLACQQSNLQLSFRIGEGAASKVTVRSVTLHDAKSGKKLDTLEASRPQSWNGNRYAAWDEVLVPGTELKVSYDLTAPRWSTFEGTYRTQYRMMVTLEIDGTTITLESTTLSREPSVDT